MKTVLVYRRGAIRECYDLGVKFLPVADCQVSVWNGPCVMIVDYEQGPVKTSASMFVPEKEGQP